MQLEVIFRAGRRTRANPGGQLPLQQALSEVPRPGFPGPRAKAPHPDLQGGREIRHQPSPNPRANDRSRIGRKRSLGARAPGAEMQQRGLAGLIEADIAVDGEHGTFGTQQQAAQTFQFPESWGSQRLSKAPDLSETAQERSLGPFPRRGGPGIP